MALSETTLHKALETIANDSDIEIEPMLELESSDESDDEDYPQVLSNEKS